MPHGTSHSNSFESGPGDALELMVAAERHLATALNLLDDLGFVTEALHVSMGYEMLRARMPAPRDPPDRRKLGVS